MLSVPCPKLSKPLLFIIIVFPHLITVALIVPKFLVLRIILELHKPQLARIKYQ